MNAKTLTQALLPIAALALCVQLALAQETPTPPAAPSDAPAAAPAAPASPAPIERHPRAPMAPRPPRPAMMRGHEPMGPMMRDHGMRGGMMGGPMGFGTERKWWKDSAVAQQLELTPEQIKRMDTIFEQSKLQLIDLHANLEKQELLLEPLLSANPVETAKASAQIDKVANARADLEKVNAKMLLGIRGVLKPEQWTKLNERRGRHGGEGFDRPEAPGAPHAPGGPGGGRGRGPGQPGAAVAPPAEF
ncbi:MAG TPA: Spy/CpxP family protein refolding chaperone [Acidobacteriaceae bacterium]|nr:Spy/CpxP family protein refolding chaperone [Acidobacteriaceae bacterium]